MPAYHQMGNDSRNLLGAVPSYSGAILSPVNECESDVTAMVKQHRSESFEFIFDPQLYFPRRSDRGQLSTWSYFPQDFDTADMSSLAWWDGILNELAATAERIGANTLCAPAALGGSTLTNDYYETMRTIGDQLVGVAAAAGVRVLQTVAVRLADLSTPGRALEIASIVSNTKSSGIYLVLLSEVKPRDELRDDSELKGAMKLIRVLEDAGLPVLVGCSSSDVVLWKVAGATSCATGKFANLRRFTPGRFNEQEKGGSQVAYWFEESLLAFIRENDIPRIRAHGMGGGGDNPFAAQILEQHANEPGKPWVGLGWRQYMWWFANIEKRLAAGTVAARDLILAAEANWTKLEENDVFLDERANTGGWLRPWLQSVVEFNKE